MKTSRRAFVFGAIAAVGTTGAISLYALNVSAEDAVASLVRSSFPDENISNADLAKFARIIDDRRGPFSRGQVLAMDSTLLREATDRLTDKDVRTTPGRIIADFVRSSDVLDPDRTGPCNYFAYADPYEVGCSNPLPYYADAQLEWPGSVYN